jgi:hypothetical protein
MKIKLDSNSELLYDVTKRNDGFTIEEIFVEINGKEIELSADSTAAIILALDNWDWKNLEAIYQEECREASYPID